MTSEEFMASLQAGEPPAGVGHALTAMWYDANDNWESAHTEAQAQEDETGAWVHAYLHRVEGDPANAAYWYRRANRPVCNDSLQEEWDSIVAELVDDD
jgi:hypothetical protein